MHRTDLAPVLSATSNRDSVWIIFLIPNLHQLNSPHLANSADQSWSRHQYTEPLSVPLFGLERLRKNCAEPVIMAHITAHYKWIALKTS